MSWGKGSRRGTGEGKAREQGRLGEVRGGRQQRVSQERVSVGPQPHSRRLKRKRDCLFGSDHRKGPAWNIRPGPRDLSPFSFWVGHNGYTSTSRLAATPPREKKHTQWPGVSRCSQLPGGWGQPHLDCVT